MASSGNMRTPAMTLGTTRYLTGLTAIVTRASICSVTRMVPSSVAMALPALPVTMRPVSTGPSSLAMLRATVGPTRLSAPNLFRALKLWRARTMPVNEPVRITTKRLWTPTNSICLKMFLNLMGGVKAWTMAWNSIMDMSPAVSTNFSAMRPIFSR